LNYRTPDAGIPRDHELDFTRVDVLAVLIITAIALFLRIRGVEVQGLWHDEFYTLANLMGFDLYLLPGSDLSPTAAALNATNHLTLLYEDNFWENLWRTILHEGPLPPLYTFLLKLWAEITTASPYSIRLFSVVASTLSIPLIYLAASSIGGRKVALLSSAFMATSPFQIYFSIEARNYSLLTLFAVLSTLVAVRLRKTKRLRISHWVYWTLSVLAACLTHYYAIIYCFFMMLFFVLPGRKFKDSSDLLKSLIYASTPFILFLFWLPILYLQVNVHGNEHWTQGALGIVASVRYTGVAFAELLGGPQINSEKIEFLLLSLLLLICIVKVFAAQRDTVIDSSRCLLLVIFAHAIFVYLLDLVIDQSTISVVRYSTCIAIPIILVIGAATAKMNVFGMALASIFLLYSTNVSILIGDAERTPKQMLREISTYINENAEPGDLVLVTPNGPSLIGLAFYLDEGTNLSAVPAESLEGIVNDPNRPQGGRIWSVQQRLGIDIESWAEPSTPMAKSVIRFVGVDLVEY
jgi:uncharacterized membrane protein